MTQHRQNRHVTRDHGTQRHGEPGITRGPNARTRKWPREEPHGAVEPRDARTGFNPSSCTVLVSTTIIIMYCNEFNGL
ncbi:hypothetical protein AMELA_G00043120 [Ameiurus melas]|uniref:Uncharacterized protein n=1 Tax=Ameiurus melas TaxID=219545 RepID=A0A7J6B641_AMEME|nr:hypothetical protein AMELA_G00043120 [Ameiurus melas]